MGTWIHWKCSEQKGFEENTEAPSEINTLLTYLLNMLSVLPRVTLLSRISATVSTPSKTKFTFCHFLQKKTYVWKIVRIPRVKNTQETDSVKMYYTSSCLSYLQEHLTQCSYIVPLNSQIKMTAEAAQVSMFKNRAGSHTHQILEEIAFN